MFFDLYLCPAANIHDLAALLTRIESDPLALVIRGVPKPGVIPGACVKRRKLVNRKTGEQPSFMEAETGIFWTMFDFDKVRLPDHIDPIKDPEAAVLFLVSRLPAQFQDRAFFWQASASAGMGDRRVFSAHVWFWFSRPVTGAELTMWAEMNRLPVDVALFRTVQAHYTAAPIFDGVPDPLPRRSGLWRGAADVVDFPRLGTAESGWTGDVPPRGERRQRATGGSTRRPSGGTPWDGSELQATHGFEAKLALLGDRDGHGLPDFHRVLLSATSSYAATHGREGTDVAALKARLREAIEAAPKSPQRSPGDILGYLSDDYLDGLIESAFDNFGDASPFDASSEEPPGSQPDDDFDIDPPPTSTSLPPYFGEEAPDRAALIEEQRGFILEWIANKAGIAGALTEIARRRAVAFKEAGLDDDAPPIAGVIDFNRAARKVAARKAAITRRIKREVLAEYGIEAIPAVADRDLVTGAQGTRKSRTTAEGIAMRTHAGVFWWLVPTLEKAEEQAEEYRRLAGPDSPAVFVVRGRSAPEPLAPGEAMCPRWEVVNRAAALGVEVEKDICRSCPLRDSCGFQRQRREMPQDGLFLMALEYLFLPCPAPKAHVVVVDETVVTKAKDVAEFDPSRITDDAKWTGGGLIEAMRHREVATAVMKAITEHAGRELEFLRAEGVTRDDIRAAVRCLASKEEARPQVSGAWPDRRIHAVLDMVDVQDFRRVLLLFRQLAKEFDRPRKRLNSIWFEPEVKKTVGGKTEILPRVYVGHVKTPRLDRATPVLALDGTGSLALNRKVFGAYMAEHRFAAPRAAEVVQVIGRRKFSRQSLTGRKPNGDPISPRKIAAAAALRAELLVWLATLPGRVLLVTYKAVEELLKAEGLPPNVVAAHFGAVRGLNSFETFETCVVLGRERPSAEGIEWQARPFTADDDAPFIPVGLYALQSRRRRMRDGRISTEEVECHPDPWCHTVSR